MTAPVGVGPVRTCIGCRRRDRVDELQRVTVGPTGALVTGAGTPGRGAWLHRDEGCRSRADRPAVLARALRIDPSERLRLPQEPGSRPSVPDSA